MKALVLLGAERMELRDEPTPTPQPGEALVRIEAAGICGSDLHSYLGHDARRPPPVILGHEACGIIESGPRAGRRVVINPQITCGACAACRSGRTNLCADKQIVSIPPRQGSFAELIALPEENLIEVPDGLDPLRAALAEPLATSCHAAAIAEPHLTGPLGDCAALVIGGGAIGLGVALVLAARGCRRIHLAERNALRRARLQEQQGFQVYDPDSEDGPQGVGLAIDAVGAVATRELACRAVAPGGTIVHIGLQDLDGGGLDLRKMTLQEVAILGSYTYTKADFTGTLAAMAEGRFGALDWFEPRRLSEGGAAFAELAAGTAAAAKIVLRPD
jgi:L-iditol 2-dehydrogenase